MNGKRVVVAGGATGIGAASARLLAAAGASVLVGDIDAAKASATAAAIRGEGGVAHAAAFDLADDGSVVDLVARATELLGGVDGLLNVGAEFSPDVFERDLDILETDLDVWRRTLDVNVLGYVRTCRAVVPHFLAQGHGAIVNVSSAAAFEGIANRAAYSASKAAVNALTRHVASAWGRAGVRCNSVAPGLVLSETVQRMDHTDVHAKVLAAVRSTRLGRPTDPAAVIAFLLSDAAEWVNGQCWNVDGGQNLRD